MSFRRMVYCFFDATTALMYSIVGPTISTVTFAWIVRSLASGSEGLSGWSWFTCVAAAPLLYLAWLIWFLAICSVEMQFHCLYMGYHKPARVSEDGFYGWRMVNASLCFYLRARFVKSLPLVDAIQTIQGLRHLVLLSYSRSTHLGFGSLVAGYLFDPDITDIGEGAILGAGTSVVAHSLTVYPDGRRLLVTSPIRIGARSVIGGDSQVHAGVCIGREAIVEPASYVAPFTVIGDGEVWGGNPARFIRQRNHTAIPAQPSDLDSTGSLLNEDIEAELRQVVAHALQLPVESITPTLSAQDTAAWDSLAQLGMAAELQNRYGITLSNQESFRLRSMDHLRDVVRHTIQVSSAPH